jgi:hypothetical protein
MSIYSQTAGASFTVCVSSSAECVHGLGLSLGTLNMLKRGDASITIKKKKEYNTMIFVLLLTLLTIAD